MNTEEIKKLVKSRGYTVEKIIRIFGLSKPTLERLMAKHPYIIAYAVMGLPEMSHDHKQRLRTLKGRRYEPK